MTLYLENFLDKFLDALVKVLQFCLMCMILAGMLRIQESNREIAQAEELLQNDNWYIYSERIPLQECIQRDLDRKTIPKAEIPELEVQETIIEVVEQEIIVEEIELLQKTVAYNLSDIELLAQMMYAEEGIFFREYDEDPAKVERVHKLAGSVALNRMNSNHMGAKSLQDVLYADGQYAKQTIRKVEEGQKMPDIVYVWAEELLQNGPIGPSSLIYQAEFEQGSEVYDQIGNQYFCTR